MPGLHCPKSPCRDYSEAYALLPAKVLHDIDALQVSGILSGNDLYRRGKRKKAASEEAAFLY